MDKSIETRATRYADAAKNQKFFDDRVNEVVANFTYNAYTMGASQQHRLDVEKVPEIYCKVCEKNNGMCKAFLHDCDTIREFKKLLISDEEWKDMK